MDATKNEHPSSLFGFGKENLSKDKKDSSYVLNSRMVSSNDYDNKIKMLEKMYNDFSENNY